MIFWSIIFAVLVIAAIVCLKKTDGWDGLDFAGIVSIACAFILAVLLVVVPLEYRAFETKFSIQKEHFEGIKEFYGQNELSYILVVDAVEANSELAEMQAKNKTYGIFSLVPDRVQDLKPICIE
jgi:hypothetical protein